MPVLEGAGRAVWWQGCQADDCVGSFGDGLRAAIAVEFGAGEAGVGRVHEDAVQRARAYCTVSMFSATLVAG